MKKKYIILLIGIITFLISLILVENTFSGFLFFFTIASICIIYDREIIINIISKSTIKEVRKLKKEETALLNEIQNLKEEENKIDLEEINNFRTIVKQERNLKTSIIVLEAKKQQLENEIIILEESNHNLKKLEESYIQLQEKKEELETEVLQLKQEIPEIKTKGSFIQNCNIKNIDSLNGYEFEKFICKLFEYLGYTYTFTTKESGDYGIDVIAEKDKIRYAIQCKNYSNVVGNKAVQEAYSGKTFYKCHVALVITNNYFTHNAIEQAECAGVVLWDRNKLEEIIKTLT